MWSDAKKRTANGVKFSLIKNETTGELLQVDRVRTGKDDVVHMYDTAAQRSWVFRYVGVVLLLEGKHPYFTIVKRARKARKTTKKRRGSNGKK